MTLYSLSDLPSNQALVNGYHPGVGRDIIATVPGHPVRPDQILARCKALEARNKKLEERNREIEHQRDLLQARIDQLLLQHPGDPGRTAEEPRPAADRTVAPGQSGLPATPPVQRCSPHDEALLEKLVGIIEANLEEPEFNVHKMCRMVHLSHMHFIRKVKQLTGKKPIDLLKSYRLRRAQELLRQNRLTVAEIAYQVGYDMPNSFSRAFKKEFGISPTEFVSV
jgi:AraC-like DNA-binding protein